MRRRIIALIYASVVSAVGVATWWLVPISPAPAEAAASPTIPVVTAQVGVSDMPLVRVGLTPSSSWRPKGRHPRLLPISAPPGVDGGLPPAMTTGQRLCVPTCLRFAVAAYAEWR